MSRETKIQLLFFYGDDFIVNDIVNVIHSSYSVVIDFFPFLGSIKVGNYPPTKHLNINLENQLLIDLKQKYPKI